MRKDNQSKNRIWSLAIVLCMVLAAGCLIFTSVIGNIPKPKVDRSVAATPEISEAPADVSSEPASTPVPNPIQKSTSSAALAETPEAGSEYVDGIYFLGDKALKALQDNNLLTGEEKDQQVWCPGNGILDLNSLSSASFLSPVTGNEVPAGDIVFVNRPKTLIILPSDDNANLLQENTLKSSINNLIASIRAEAPDTQIILTSLTPIAESYEYEDVNIDVINRVNGWIAEAAESNEVKYLDAAFELAGTDGFLPDNFHTGDGMHLNAQGLSAWFDCVKTHAYSN